MAMQKCSELESEKTELEQKIEEQNKTIEDKDLRIEHLTELVLKRNKMLFGQKSEKSKFICDGQLAFEGLFNEAEAESNPAEPEPTPETLMTPYRPFPFGVACAAIGSSISKNNLFIIARAATDHTKSCQCVGVEPQTRCRKWDSAV
jgi:hypothetical protein